MQILHFSDTHNQYDANRIAVRSAKRHSETCKVVALTGDICSKTTPEPEAILNQMPQRTKLFAPGNHDQSATYRNLVGHWEIETPWVRSFRGALFIGLDSNLPPNDFLDQTEVAADLGAEQVPRLRLIVLLTHHRLAGAMASAAAGLFSELGSSNVECLWLHGHDHPRSFTSEWSERARLGNRLVARSHVCSCSHIRGLGHLITFSRGKLSCVQVANEAH